VILAAALAVAVASADSRDALLSRWKGANREVVPVSRRLDETPAASPPPAQLLSDLAKRELLGPEYRLGDSNAPLRRTLWQRFWDWVADRWSDLMQWFSDRAHLGSTGSTAIGFVLMIVATVVILVVGIRLLSEIQIVRLQRGRSTPLGEPVDASAMYSRACDRAQAGDYAAAVRLLFVATIAVLDLHGAVRDDASSTVGEFRTILRRKRGDLVPAYNQIAGTFVRSAYAEQGIASAQWEGARQAFQSLEAGTQT
jgi:hypothetical protein